MGIHSLRGKSLKPLFYSMRTANKISEDGIEKVLGVMEPLQATLPAHGMPDGSK